MGGGGEEEDYWVTESAVMVKASSLIISAGGNKGPLVCCLLYFFYSLTPFLKAVFDLVTLWFLSVCWLDCCWWCCLSISANSCFEKVCRRWNSSQHNSHAMNSNLLILLKRNCSDLAPHFIKQRDSQERALKECTQKRMEFPSKTCIVLETHKP